MRILLTTDTYEPSVNGVVISTKTLFTQLKARGHDVKIMSPQKHTAVHDDNYDMASISFPIYPDVRFATSNLIVNKHIRELIRWKPDIVHSQTEFSMNITARFIAFTTKAQLVNTVHTLYEDYTRYLIPGNIVGPKAVGHFMRQSLRPCSAVISPSEKIKELLERYQVKNPIHVIPTGIDLHRFTTVEEHEAQHLKRQLGIPPHAFCFVHVGRMAAEKNQDEIIEAFAQSQQRCDASSYLIMVGDGPYKHELEACAQRLNLGETVRFTGLIDPRDVPLYYKLGNVFVNASNSETQGLTYVEALSCGIPLLVKDDSCLEGVLFEGKNGWSYKEKKQLAQLMSMCSRMPQCAHDLKAYALESAYNHSAEKFGERVECLYTQLINQAAKK